MTVGDTHTETDMQGKVSDASRELLLTHLVSRDVTQ